MSIGRRHWWAALVWVAVCALTLCGCGGIKKSKIVIPVNPQEVDPPRISVTASATGLVILATPTLPDSTVVDVYINGNNIGKVTVQSGSVTIQVPPSYPPGDYALALVDPAAGDVRLEYVLTVP